MKPILFNGEMVRAILDGRKTVTRRIVNKNIINGCDIDVDGNLLEYENCYGDFLNPIVLCRYRKGDVLYVRETFTRIDILDSNEDIIEYDVTLYAADSQRKDLDYDTVKWRPSIHMPKEAARIFLKVTSVRVERLQDMKTDDVIKEGVYPLGAYYYGSSRTQLAFDLWIDLWNSTIKKTDLDQSGWDANPWVWVIEFERCEKPNDGRDYHRDCERTGY